MRGAFGRKDIFEGWVETSRITAVLKLRRIKDLIPAAKFARKRFLTVAVRSARHELTLCGIELTSSGYQLYPSLLLVCRRNFCSPDILRDAVHNTSSLCEGIKIT